MPPWHRHSPHRRRPRSSAPPAVRRRRRQDSLRRPASPFPCRSMAVWGSAPDGRDLRTSLSRCCPVFPARNDSPRFAPSRSRPRAAGWPDCRLRARPSAARHRKADAPPARSPRPASASMCRGNRCRPHAAYRTRSSGNRSRRCARKRSADRSADPHPEWSGRRFH